MDLTWIDPVIAAAQSLLGLFSNPPLSYFIGLILIGGVVAIIKGIIKK